MKRSDRLGFQEAFGSYVREGTTEINDTRMRTAKKLAATPIDNIVDMMAACDLAAICSVGANTLPLGTKAPPESEVVEFVELSSGYTRQFIVANNPAGEIVKKLVKLDSKKAQKAIETLYGCLELARNNKSMTPHLFGCKTND